VDNSNLDKKITSNGCTMKGVIFKLEHLDRYAIVKEPCNVDCKKQPKLAMDDLHRRQQSRWILNLKVISELIYATKKELSKSKLRALKPTRRERQRLP
jgi:hypothetical protein